MQVKRIHIILFLLTVATTFTTGYSFSGSVSDAISFSLALLFILGSHEMGHYYYGRKYGISITPPYFIPAPPFISPIGTFGAFIKIRSPISTKKALFDIGIAGPIAGLVATIPVLILGIKMSKLVNLSEQQSEGGLFLGASLVFSLITESFFGEIPDGYDLFLHPIAFAGWIGLFITALNLIPSGQLDGGHLIYSLFSRKFHKYTSMSMIGLLIILGLGTERLIEFHNNYLISGIPWFTKYIPIFEGWPGWFVWAILLTLMGTRHPPTIHEENGLDSKRKIIGLSSLLIFIGCFSPVPIKLI